MTAMTLKQIDVSELILDSYRINGITASECRSIFVDWALKLPADVAPHDAITHLLSVYAADAPDHPMTAVLQEGLAAPAKPKRRGGRSARVPSEP